MYVEFSHRSELLHETVQTITDLELQVRDLAMGPETPLRFTCSVSGCAADRFARVAGDDPSVAEVKQLDCRKLRRLYWIKAVSGTVDQHAYESAIDSGAVYLQSRRAEDRWVTSMNFPDQHSFQEFQRRIDEAGMTIEPTLVRAGQYRLSGGATNLTEKQEAVLTAAIECGYFQIPREGSLDQIAADLGISRQAASERLRRAMGSLARAAVNSGSE